MFLDHTQRRSKVGYVPIVLKFGSLTHLESSGPVQACNGIALPLHLVIKYTNVRLELKVVFLCYGN